MEGQTPNVGHSNFYPTGYLRSRSQLHTYISSAEYAGGVDHTTSQGRLENSRAQKRYETFYAIELRVIIAFLFLFQLERPCKVKVSAGAMWGFSTFGEQVTITISIVTSE